MNNSQLTLAIRRECISSLWIKCQGITVVSDWQCLDKLSILAVHNRHQFIGASGEECMASAIDIESGFPPVSIFVSTFSVFRSKTETLFSPPLLVNPTP